MRLLLADSVPQLQGLFPSSQSYICVSLVGSSNCPSLVSLGLCVVKAFLLLALNDWTLLCSPSILQQHFVNSPSVNVLILNYPYLKVQFFSYCDLNKYTKLRYRVLTLIPDYSSYIRTVNTVFDKYILDAHIYLCGILNLPVCT